MKFSLVLLALCLFSATANDAPACNDDTCQWEGIQTSSLLQARGAVEKSFPKDDHDERTEDDQAHAYLESHVHGCCPPEFGHDLCKKWGLPLDPCLLQVRGASEKSFSKDDHDERAEDDQAHEVLKSHSQGCCPPEIGPDLCKKWGLPLDPCLLQVGAIEKSFSKDDDDERTEDDEAHGVAMSPSQTRDPAQGWMLVYEKGYCGGLGQTLSRDTTDPEACRLLAVDVGATGFSMGRRYREGKCCVETLEFTCELYKDWQANPENPACPTSWSGGFHKSRYYDWYAIEPTADCDGS